ncbi:hypothetical protein [Phaeacidiphilus oryzae]|jgi:hypothetical protein|uniref:hypothetical protein n=1 Tax=Phaeacidiphilus oryzae TaxID=348818 RepID=UPI00055ECAC5|nr:hypothetical protein [Phaeacidiphilus oryzae]
MARIPSSLIAAGGLLGGYTVARTTKKRQLGGLAFGAALAAATPQWRKAAGNAGAAALAGLSVGALAVSHPLAKKIGPWPAVAAVSTATAAASWLIADRRA